MIKTCLVIPTYWGPIDGDEEVLFDHPTPLDHEGTLNRLLEQLKGYEAVARREIPVCVVAVPNKARLWPEVDARLARDLAAFAPHMDVRLCGAAWFEALEGALADIPEATRAALLRPGSYGQVRNLCLLAALQTGAEAGVFLDDDELLMDDDYFERAVDGLLERMPDRGVMHGKAGYYEQDRPSMRWWRELRWWPKDKVFNEAFERLMGETPRFKATTIAMGGNMVMSREIMRRVFFDPRIRRGEDIDYVFNARMSGYRFYFDPELRIAHHAPSLKTPAWRKAREDMLRFMYLRAKFRGHMGDVRVQKVALDELQPYPGTFMQADLEERILEHARLTAMQYLAQGDAEAFEGSMSNALDAHKAGFDPEEVINLFVERRQQWEEITEAWCRAYPEHP